MFLTFCKLWAFCVQMSLDSLQIESLVLRRETGVALRWRPGRSIWQMLWNIFGVREAERDTGEHWEGLKDRLPRCLYSLYVTLEDEHRNGAKPPSCLRACNIARAPLTDVQRHGVSYPLSPPPYWPSPQRSLEIFTTLQSMVIVFP